MEIDLNHSDYATTSTSTDAGGGSASVTATGTEANIEATLLLAADGIHELRGSPTVDKGVVLELSGEHDIDGQ